MSSSQAIRTRIAPSPTGEPHVGTAYMALFNYLFARHHGGEFILRIEDTDQKRSRREYEEAIFRALCWLGLSWDEGPDVGGERGPYRQSERTEIYRAHCAQLLREDKAYKCFATERELREMREWRQQEGGRMGYDRRYRYLSKREIAEREKRGEPYVIRLKVPLEGECIYEDLAKGRCLIPWAEVDDQVLLKSDGFPTYHLANVVDDHLMGISHVIRGEEWLSSTPKHLLLYELFGWSPPRFLHMPLLLDNARKKLSKRKNPTSIFFYQQVGYLPEAFCNFLSLMGYRMADEREIYSLEECVEQFDFRRIGCSGAIFDVRKLDWMNQKYIERIPEEQLWNRIAQWGFSSSKMQALMPLCHTRMKNFGEFMELASFFFTRTLPFSQELLTPGQLSAQQSALLLQTMIWEMDQREDWSKEGFEAASQLLSTLFPVRYKKEVIPLLFVALTGKPRGLPLFRSVAILGKERTRARLLEAIAYLGGISGKRERGLREIFEGKEGREWFLSLCN